MSTTAVATDISFEPATGLVGAWVHGVSLDDRDPEVAKLLERRLHEHGVLFFQFDHALTGPEFMGFSTMFGEPEDGYRITLKEETDSPYIDSDMAPMKEVRINYWHSDGTALECPPQAAMLTPVELPPAGGDTMWASMYAAWDALSPHYQKLLEGLEVQHGTARLPFLRETPSMVHPAVIRDPVTGRKLLFVNSNYSERFVGMSLKESDALLQMLFDHINTPEFHVRLRWRPGIVAVWEERVVQHRGVADFTGPRKLRRITFKGGKPSA